MAGVMGDEWRELALEEAVEQPLALAGDVVGARDQWAVEGAAVDALRRQGLLLQQPVDQGLDRGAAPALGTTDRRHDLVRRERTFPPQRLHHLTFRGRDTRHGWA